MKFLKGFTIPILLFIASMIGWSIHLIMAHQAMLVDFPGMPFEWVPYIPLTYISARLIFGGYLAVLAIAALQQYLGPKKSVLQSNIIPLGICVVSVIAVIAYALISYQMQIKEYPETTIGWLGLVNIVVNWGEFVFCGYIVILGIKALNKYLDGK